TKIGYIVGSNINMRKLPDIASESITRLANNKKVNVIAASGDWYKIQSGDVKGWVHKDFLKVITQKEQDALTARKTEQERTLVATKSVAQPTKIIAPSVNNTSTTSDQVIEYAKKFLGTKYVYGGSSPSGFDCSGFVCYVYKNFGISLNRSSADMASNGVSVAKSNLKPGDLVFFDTNMEGKISHVGIYIGNGQFIQSSSGSTMKVIISSLEGTYSKKYVTARRVLN
ncbi:MAG TPA: SH3 domain-containing C40 family peptidase, partial [Clostridia bacterium]|nr:SH3 domain-containing C40 family peptidase [Clostridia bacterium]